MKKIIDGKKYDTDTATEIGEWENMYDPRNFDYIQQVLYRKRTGEYFLYEYGNANTRYAKKVGSNSWQGASYLTPVSYETAQKWAEDHLTADEFEAEFGEVDEDEERVHVNAFLDAATNARLRKIASSHDWTLTETLERMINSFEE